MAHGDHATAKLLERVIDFIRTSELVPRSWLVGGYVRDYLLGRPPTNDIDVVVEVAEGPSQRDKGGIRLARAVAAAFDGDFFVLDEERDVARAILRADAKGSALSPARRVGDSPAPRVGVEVDIARLRAATLREDLRLRDFTVNAIAMDPQNSGAGVRVYDPFDGRADLERRWLRAVTPNAFRDDPVRMLRAVRLGAELGFCLEPRTAALMARDAELVAGVSAERVRDELSRMMATPEVWRQMQLLARTGLLRHVVPEAAILIGIEQSPPHYQDVFDHTLSTMAHLEGIFALIWPRSPYGYRRPRRVTGDATVIASPAMWSELAKMLADYRQDLRAYLQLPLASGRSRFVGLMWAALAHDWGKPAMRTVEPGGRARFLEHDHWGALLARRRAQGLKMAADEIAYQARLVEMHMRPAYLAHDYPPSARAIYRYYRDARGTGPDGALLSLADHIATRAPQPDPERWVRRLGTTRMLLDAYFRSKPRLVEPAPLLDGAEIIAEFGLKPGPLIGRLLEELREAQVAAEVTTRDEAIARVTAQISRESPGSSLRKGPAGSPWEQGACWE